MSFQVKRAMTTNVVSIRPEATVDDACSLLLRHHVSGLPVVDEDNRLVGILSECDLLVLFSDATCQSHSISGYMQEKVLTVTEEDSLTDVVDLFVSRRFRRIPVVRDGKLVGIISRRDLIRFTRDLRQVIQGARKEEQLLFRTQQEIANHCGVDKRDVRRGLQSGDPPVVKDGEFYRLTRNELSTLFGCA